MPYFLLEKSASLPRWTYHNEHGEYVWCHVDAEGFATMRTIVTYSDRPSAFRAMKADNLQSTHRIEFLASSDEMMAWQSRETDRFAYGTYIDVPWKPIAKREYESHYAHLSLNIPGMVAYTESTEKGIQDRQTRLTPGRYLERFYADVLSREEIADYIAKVQAFADCNGLKLARTQEEIRYVYSNGPQSCMGGGADHTNQYWKPNRLNGRHPIDVYALPSDLAVAYVGDLDGDISQRCVVWPVKKRYSRVYGSGPLRHILCDNGYSEGSMKGARIRAIEYDNGYIVPYIDNVDNCEPSDDGKFLILGDGDISTSETQGHACSSGYDPEEDFDSTCEHCNERYDSNDDESSSDYCGSCERSRYTCYHCDRNVWRYDYEVIDKDPWCNDCVAEHRKECADENCNNRFILENDFTDDEIRERERHDLNDLCATCAARYAYCEKCETSYDTTIDTDNGDCPTCHRSPRSEETLDLLATLDTMYGQDAIGGDETIAGLTDRLIDITAYIYSDNSVYFTPASSDSSYGFAFSDVAVGRLLRDRVMAEYSRPVIGQIASEHASAF